MKMKAYGIGMAINESILISKLAAAKYQLANSISAAISIW